MDLYVGLPALRGRIERYRFGLLELPVSASLPKNKTLRGFREAKPGLVFSLRLPPEVAEGAPSAEALLGRTRVAAELLAARFVVVPTGPRFRPTTSNRKRLVEVCQSLAADGRTVAWEPRGMWEGEELVSWAASAGVTLVRDLTRESAPEGGLVYTRLLPFGVGSRLSQHALEKLALSLDGRQECYVVLGGDAGLGVQSRLRQMLELGSGVDEADDAADDDEVDEGDPDEQEGDDE